MQPACHGAIPTLPLTWLPCARHTPSLRDAPSRGVRTQTGAMRGQAQSRAGRGTWPCRPGTLVGKQRLAYFSPRNPERRFMRRGSGRKSSGRGFAWDLTLGLSRPKSSWPRFPAPGRDVHQSKRLAEGPGHTRAWERGTHRPSSDVLHCLRPSCPEDGASCLQHRYQPTSPGKQPTASLSSLLLRRRCLLRASGLTLNCFHSSLLLCQIL